ncbi:RT0821/Lpp0805 family surface protein [Methylobacterium isbiliense]|jgi:surface antigen|uniref:Surface antigen domain-containing protein n=1 Tax=Methylobacterium isbiliense TaxID=315478 RepID=A0ABQ4SNL7_9HYPH|nr:RT0821/Lpp0805 family surface protein [Methylobacterium isbiliense]MDN3624560.1 RT0821/Lpp0805 family surface protein [Methylobacterium isbiliense]GJE03473.1 hypothetical protein GMJLKIPL_5428 [Methylobacterium isbiliense]
MRRFACKGHGRECGLTAALLVGPALLAGALGLVALGGCTQPLITFAASPAPPPEPATTGSIETGAPRSFGTDLSVEDWRRAKAALGVALDPQGNGQPVKWDNPDSQMRGMVNPTGLPYVANDEICRNFLATVIAPSGSRFVRGTGCRPSGGSWELKSLKATRAPA